MIVVANSSPLISLSSADHLFILEKLYGEIHISEAVFEEITVAGAGRAGSAEVAGSSWIRRHKLANNQQVEQIMAAAKLNRGESATIALAKEIKADLLLIDELPARRYAAGQNLPVIGSLGVLLLAKKQGIIPLIKPVIEEMANFGMRVHPKLLSAVLAEAGEESAEEEK